MMLSDHRITVKSLCKAYYMAKDMLYITDYI